MQALSTHLKCPKEDLKFPDQTSLTRKNNGIELS